MPRKLAKQFSIINWLGRDLGPMTNKTPLRTITKIAHSGARLMFDASKCQYSSSMGKFERGALSAIVFGCRRSDGLPLVVESLSWKHGGFMAVSLRSESANKTLVQYPVTMPPKRNLLFKSEYENIKGIKKSKRNLFNCFRLK
uniref:Phosphoenolpyruvate carboxykinase C-terminal P-loop domain-containing protein n=1 Tax=Ditylenchus dipsaci TaxID=166011 RepID=A0A915DKJ0_9BILA